jgi:hypothetical protein
MPPALVMPKGQRRWPSIHPKFAVKRAPDMTRSPAKPPLCTESRGLLRFTVDMGDKEVSAFLSDAVWQARYSDFSDSNLTELYQQHRPVIDAAVARRVQSGAREPVVLRPSDLI